MEHSLYNRISEASENDASEAAKLMFLAFDELSYYLFGTKDLTKIANYFSKLWINEKNRLSSRYSYVIRENEKAIGLLSCTEGDLTSKLIFSSFITFLKINPKLILFIFTHIKYLLAILSVKEAMQDEYYIFVLAVVPEHQNKGIGSLLINFAEEKALEKGFKKVSLLVSAKNTNAIRFYERNGYKKVELINKPPINNYRMVKQLN